MDTRERSQEPRRDEDDQERRGRRRHVGERSRAMDGGFLGLGFAIHETQINLHPLAVIP